MSRFSPYFSSSPWILALFPPILTIRGSIGGIFAGNLATMLHLGLVEPRLRGNSESYYDLLKSVIVITTLDTLFLGIISFLMNILTGKADIFHLPYFLLIPTTTCILAVSLSIPITNMIAVETFKRGLDPDILVYPILASINDIIVTVFFALTIVLTMSGFLGWVVIGVIFSLIMSLTCYLILKNFRKRFFRQTMREGSTGVIIASVMGSFNGVFLSIIQPALSLNRGFVALYPALTNALGNIGSIVGSVSTTNMALGYTRKFIDELRGSLNMIIQIEASAATMHVVFALISFYMVGGGVTGPLLPQLVVVALSANFSSFLFISLLALAVANLTFKRGLNPDNLVIPAITSISDSVATLSILPAIRLAMAIFG